MTPRRLAAVEIEGRERALVRYFAMCGVWALNTYTACDIRCSYCITHAQGPSTPRWARDVVGDRLRLELADVPTDGVIGVGAQIDAYPTAEAREGVTREALSVLTEQSRRVIITTKGTTVVRDCDLIAALPDASVNVSLFTLDDALLRSLEPGAPTSGERLAAVNFLASVGVDVQLLVQPWVPGVTVAEALVDAVDETVPVWFAPLIVASPAVRRTALGRRFTQAEVDDAYQREMERTATRRPNITWFRPLWMSRPDQRPPARTGSESGEERNASVVRRLVEALSTRTQLQVLFDVWSPYIRGREHGSVADPGASTRGVFRDALFESTGAFTDARYEITSLDTHDDRVRARIAISGRHDRPFLGVSPSHEHRTFTIDHVFRFDEQGLVVELEQDVELGALALAPKV